MEERTQRISGCPEQIVESEGGAQSDYRLAAHQRHPEPKINQQLEGVPSKVGVPTFGAATAEGLSGSATEPEERILPESKSPLEPEDFPLPTRSALAFGTVPDFFGSQGGGGGRWRRALGSRGGGGREISCRSLGGCWPNEHQKGKCELSHDRTSGDFTCAITLKVRATCMGLCTLPKEPISADQGFGSEEELANRRTRSRMIRSLHAS